MKTTELSQSITVDEILPQFIAENNSAFVQFIKAYYDWMEQEGNVNNIIHTMGMAHEDKFVEDLYQLYLNEYASVYPYNKAVRKDIFLKHIRHVLSCKGSVDSIKHFFRAIYDQEVDVVFPRARRKTYTGSDLYLVKTHIFLNDTNIQERIDELNSLKGNYIVGEFRATAMVESLRFYDIGAYKVVEISISNLLNSRFVSGEIATSTFKVGVNQTQDSQENPVTVSFVVGGIISDYEIISPGSGYVEGQAILVPSDSKIESCTAYVSSVGENGEILSITIVNPGYGYEVDTLGEFPLSGGNGAVVNFKASSSTKLDDTQSIANLLYLEYDKAVIGRPQQEYFVSNYIEDGYIVATTGSRNPSDYNVSKIRSKTSEVHGRHYFEFSVNADSTNENLFPSQMKFGFSNESFSQNFWLNSSEIPQGSGYMTGLRVFCFAIRFKVGNKADIYIGSVYSTNGGTKICQWKDGNGVSTAPNTPAFSDVDVPTGGLFPSAEFRITPYQKIKLLTTPAEFYGQVSNDFFAWDFGGSSTFAVQDDDNTTVSHQNLYRYTIRTSLSSPVWNKVYKLAIHPAGTKYEVDFVNYTNATSDTNPALSMEASSTFYPEICNYSFAKYDIAAREHLRLDSLTDLYGPVRDNEFSPASGAIVHDLPTNIFDMDMMINPATSVYVSIE